MANLDYGSWTRWSFIWIQFGPPPAAALVRLLQMAGNFPLKLVTCEVHTLKRST